MSAPIKIGIDINSDIFLHNYDYDARHIHEQSE